MFSEINHRILCLLIWHLSSISGEHLCKDKLLKRSNVSTELQSDVLLPCDFDPALLGSDKTADIAVQWRQINTTSHGLLEISLQGEAMFWNNKKGRIKHFPKLSESGNFSLLLQKVQPYDLSLYTCELFNGTSSIGCQEIELQKNWAFIAGGGAVAFIFLLVVACLIKRACSNSSNNHIYANSRFDKRKDKQLSEDKHSSPQRRAKAKNEVYANMPQNHRNIYANSHMQAEDVYVNKPR
ncbi:hypothetical protein KOW79_022061 [Hemibagrus wyckioides]|uniref:Ig-like domain-containing protein n=1 Tax=Hemibagrus wyckioides TaxID=337641 RepID=A0A9D3N4M6_9TELE|nr:hypothetical protein KOW79_022061 [Hemibagrus wyckioides]